MMFNTKSCDHLSLQVKMGLCPHASKDLQMIYGLYLLWFALSFFSLFAFRQKCRQFSQIFDILNCSASD